jgi:transportin-3
MTLFDLVPQEAGAWLQSTLQMLPAGTMKPGEAERLLKGIADKVQTGEIRKIRSLLQGRTKPGRSTVSITTNSILQTLPTHIADETWHLARA